MDIIADKVIEAFVTLRDQRDEMKKRHKEELAPITDNLDKCAAWLHQHLLKAGLQSCASKTATAFFKDATEVKVQNWEETIGFIQEKQAWDLLERRISKAAYVDYKAAGIEVPGVTYTVDRQVHVQRK